MNQARRPAGDEPGSVPAVFRARAPRMKEALVGLQHHFSFSDPGVIMDLPALAWLLGRSGPV
jgi:hypothetical protein